MPIQEKDLGKYKRPAIYIEETDNSIVDTPAQNALINLIPGFSKKGPFNNPVYIDNKIDFRRVFGDLDRQLENKESYFHRTSEKMLESGPIWALNLLSTVPNRDILNYVSVSASSGYENSDFTNQYTADYERFFNRQDFWIRDEESFLDVVNDPTEDTKRLLHLSNMGDKTITTFIWKSDITGFDVTASSWYGGDTKVPTYIHPKSLISDYIVTVLILSGDWTDYKSLSVDTTWSKYFSLDGLDITSVQDFVNENGVTTLGSYDVSLIPNFKDLNNRDMYIENVINNNTDKTSLFCTYNEDLLLDNDYLSDLVDLIGNTIVGVDTESIEFLSYDQTIKETITYPLVSLDSINNVFGTGNLSSLTHIWDNWTTTGIQWDTFNDVTLEAEYVVSTAKYIINGVQYDLLSGNTEITAVTDGYKRLDVLYLDSDGIHSMNGVEVLIASTATPREITFTNENTIILGTLLVNNNSGYTSTYTEITVDGSGFVTPTITGLDVSGATNYVEIEFVNTSGSTIKNSEYSKLRLNKIYNEMVTQLSLNKGVIISNSGGTMPNTKTAIVDPSAFGYTTTTNSKIWIYVDIPSDYVSGDDFLLYYVDKEFKLSSSVTTVTTSDATNATSNVAIYSDFYTDFVNGEINNGDYILVGSIKVYLTMFVDSTGLLTLTFDTVTDGSTGISVHTDIGNWKQTLEIENIADITDYTNTVAIKVKKERYSEIIRGYYLEAYYDETYYGVDGDGATKGDIVPRKLTRIIDIKNDTVDTTLKILYTDAPIKIITITGTTEIYTTAYPAVYKYATTLKGMSLKPFVLHTDSIPNGTETRLNSILDVIAINTSIYNGLINQNKISWRYLVDTFGLGLAENSKQQYLDLCGKKLSCIGFINMPSAKSFKKSSNPSFTNDDGSLSSTYIKEGANQEKNPDFLYSFGDGVGRSTTGYFFPYVKSTYDGISSMVPPAGTIATSYMRKFTTSTAGVQPWTIAAGVNDGRLPDISGTEMDFTNDDLDNFAEMGANPIVFIRNVGYITNDENTAQVFPISSLSYLHSREVLIELEQELYNMLLRYQWKFNTPSIRSEIKYRADRICQRYLDSSALYAYKNIIDESNNTPYIIDLQGGVLDTHIEIVKGMGWIVNNITIEKTGTINSSGFQQ
jgi:hypothetical protein